VECDSLFYPVVIGFIFGALFGPIVSSWFFLGVVILTAAVLFGWLWSAGLLYKNPAAKQYSWFTVFLVATLFASVGCGAFLIAAGRSGDPAFGPEIGKWVRLEGVVSDEPAENETATRVTIAATKVNGEVVGATGVIFSVPPYTEVNYGDAITVSGLLEKPEAFATENGGVFLYDKYLAVHGVFYTLMRPTKFEVVDTGRVIS